MKRGDQITVRRSGKPGRPSVRTIVKHVSAVVVKANGSTLCVEIAGVRLWIDRRTVVTPEAA